MNSNKIILDLCGEKYERNIYYDHKGYACVCINGREYKVHILIWQSVNGVKPKGYEIHHKDKNKANYSISNLELLTPSEHRRIHAGWVRTGGIFTHKPCNGCKQILPLNDFYFANTRKIETALCKVCHNEVTSGRNQKPELKEKIKGYKRNYYRKHYVKQKRCTV